MSSPQPASQPDLAFPEAHNGAHAAAAIPQPLTPNPRSRRLAVLIDGDNAQPSMVEAIFAALTPYGQPVVRRIYGDWSRGQMRGWREAAGVFAFALRQHYPAAVGKNSTDILLTIDTMDLLHAGIVDGFCLVSSDSDYTALATRIREGGGFVIGVGKRLTPIALVRACDVFLFTEDLAPPATSVASSSAPPPPAILVSANGAGQAAAPVPSVQPIPYSPPASASPSPHWRVIDPDLAARRHTPALPTPKPDAEKTRRLKPVPNSFFVLFHKAYTLAKRPDGWAALSALSNRLHQLDAGFKPKKYGYPRLLLLLQAHPQHFELRALNGNVSHMMVRPRRGGYWRMVRWSARPPASSAP